MLSLCILKLTCCLKEWWFVHIQTGDMHLDRGLWNLAFWLITCHWKICGVWFSVKLLQSKKYNYKQAKQFPTVDHCGLKRMQIWLVVCCKVFSPGGLDWDHHWLTEHWGIVGTELPAGLIAQLIEHVPCKRKVLALIPSWGSTFWHTHLNGYLATQKIQRGKHVSSVVKFGIYHWLHKNK